MTCRAQQFGRYLEVEGYSMTLQKNHVWAIIIILKLFHRNEHHIESPCCERHLGRYLKGQGHSMTLQKKGVRPITLLFQDRFHNFVTEMIINGNKQELMIIKELFEGPVGDYCFARNTIKCLFY